MGGPTSTMDVPVTILDILHGSVPEGMAGASLVPRMRGEASDTPPIFFSLVERNWSLRRDATWAIMQDDYLLVWHQVASLRSLYDSDYVELFDVVRDPHNRSNLESELPAVTSRLMTLLLSRGAGVQECWCAPSR